MSRSRTIKLVMPPEFVSPRNSHGVQPDQVIRGFIADLRELRTACDNTGESDERLYAEQYCHRRGYRYWKS
jgi:hypothetical protein